MPVSATDKQTLRTLAQRYGEIASLDIQRERIERYEKTNALEDVRPVVLIDEVPWGEIEDDPLLCVCSDEARWLERRLRYTLYQWEHFQVDLALPPAFRVPRRRRSSGTGVQVEETRVEGDSGTHICAHEYKDVLQTEDDLERLQLPVIRYDREATEKMAELACDVFDGIMPVELSGCSLQFSIWDDVARLRGVDNLLMDLAVRPDFMHKTAQRFTEIAEATFRQFEELDLLDPNPMLLHCTVGCSKELPADDFEGKVRPRDVWGRCAAQIFGAVSPAMHDEFDLAYNEILFGACGLVYYGCCEPMDNKIDILRRRFKNLRKVSITPWADPERAAGQMGRDLVMAAKPNPAFVSSRRFDPKPVEEEITGYLEACRRHGTPCEFVLKDISTIANNPDNLTQWAETVTAVVDRYYG